MGLESGLRRQRLGFIREDVLGQVPQNPEWLAYSDSIQSVTNTPSTVIAIRRRVGNEDIQSFTPGSEEHEYEVVYDLMQWLKDGTGNPLDASIDAIERSEDGQLLNSHSILQRDILGGTGTAGGGRRMYTVINGAKINTASFTGEPGTGEPIVVTLNYMAIKTRSYLVNQPESSTQLTVRSTNAGDTTQELTIESDGASTSETVELNGTTPVTTTASFTSIDAAFLNAETIGDIVVEDGDENVLLTIHGRASYQDREGDLGIPLLGNGAHAAPINGTPELLLGDTFDRAGDPILSGADISSVNLEVDNSIESESTHRQIGRKLEAGPRTVTLNAVMFGERISFDSIREHLQVVEADIVWGMSSGTVTLSGAVLTEPGAIAKEAEQAILTVDNVFTAKGIAVSNAN